MVHNQFWLRLTLCAFERVKMQKLNVNVLSNKGAASIFYMGFSDGFAVKNSMLRAFATLQTLCKEEKAYLSYQNQFEICLQ